MIDLPLWAQNDEARALLASVVANPPETRIRRDDWGAETVYRSWQRPDVGALKRMFTAWWDANHETATALPESPDALIGRLLAEHEAGRLLVGKKNVVPYTPMRIDLRDDGGSLAA
jgi:hypothetical protein